MGFDNTFELEYYLINNYDIKKIDLDEDEENVFIQWLIVDKGFRRNGIGSEVIEIISEYSEKNNKDIYIELPGTTNIEVLDDNELEQFYHKNNFTKLDKGIMYKQVMISNHEYL